MGNIFLSAKLHQNLDKNMKSLLKVVRVGVKGVFKINVEILKTDTTYQR